MEAGVLTVERWVLAPLRKQRFFSRALTVATRIGACLQVDWHLQGGVGLSAIDNARITSGRLGFLMPEHIFGSRHHFANSVW